MTDKKESGSKTGGGGHGGGAKPYGGGQGNGFEQAIKLYDRMLHDKNEQNFLLMSENLVLKSELNTQRPEKNAITLNANQLKDIARVIYGCETEIHKSVIERHKNFNDSFARYEKFALIGAITLGVVVVMGVKAKLGY